MYMLHFQGLYLFNNIWWLQNTLIENLKGFNTLKTMKEVQK